jgi:hypothetical protein
MDYKQKPRKPARRGKCFCLFLTAVICFAASAYIYIEDMTATADRASLILGAILGIVNLIMFASIIAAAALFLADLQDGR